MYSMIKNFVEEIVKKRNQKRLSQEALAQLADISVVTMNSIENENIVPDVDTCLKLAEVLEIPIEEIFADYNIEEQEENKRRKVIKRLLIVIGVLLIVNVGMELYLKWNYEYTMHNRIWAKVIALEEDVITVKNTGTIGIEGDDIYIIKLNDELKQMCESIQSGDVIFVHYYFGLTDMWLNPSWTISEIELDEYSTKKSRTYN